MRRDEIAVSGERAVAFPSDLDWMAAVWRNGQLKRLAFGYHSAHQALDSVDADPASQTPTTSAMDDVIARLQRFAGGEPVDFLDVPLDLGDRTPFQRAVLKRCRQIPFGHVMTYGQLAARAGYPRSARAVGNVMSTNRIPLIIPCHRVVGAAGALGGFSAPDGVDMKRRLLQMEGAPRARQRRPGLPV